MKIGKHQLTPSQLATSVWSNLGARGSGKTNAAGVVAEGIMDAGIPVIVIDQVGVWFGLRLKPDGKTPSRFKLPILGGAHGDIPLEPGSGRQVAEALAASQSSAILDVSQLRKGERARFCADFAEAFLHAKKSAASAVCVILEEAQEVVPQMMRFTSPDLSRCLGAFEDIASMGRNFGIGLGLLSLRPQKINKELLNLSETVFAFRMGGPSERKAVAEWVQEKGAPGREDVAGELPSLPRGTAILWSPGLFGIYDRVALPLKSTYDASSTPGAGRADVKTSPLDLAALEKAMATVVAEAKANDPRALKAEIADLRRQLAAKPGAAPAPSPKVIEKQVISDAVLKRVEATARRFEEALIRIDETTLNPTRAELRALMDLLKVAPQTPETRLLPRAPAGYVPNPAPRTTALQPADAGTASDLPAGEAKVLTALAQYEDGCDRSQLSVLTGYKRSTRDRLLQYLGQKGFTETRGDRILASADGIAALGSSFERLPTGDALRAYWMGRLPHGEATVLKVVCDGHPNAVDREAISAATDYKRSTRDRLLQYLGARKLVESTRDGVTAAAELFG